MLYCMEFDSYENLICAFFCTVCIIIPCQLVQYNNMHSYNVWKKFNRSKNEQSCTWNEIPIME